MFFSPVNQASLGPVPYVRTSAAETLCWASALGAFHLMYRYCRRLLLQWFVWPNQNLCGFEAVPQYFPLSLYPHHPHTTACFCLWVVSLLKAVHIFMLPTKSLFPNYTFPASTFCLSSFFFMLWSPPRDFSVLLLFTVSWLSWYPLTSPFSLPSAFVSGLERIAQILLSLSIWTGTNTNAAFLLHLLCQIWLNSAPPLLIRWKSASTLKGWGINWEGAAGETVLKHSQNTENRGDRQEVLNEQICW